MLYILNQNFAWYFFNQMIFNLEDFLHYIICLPYSIDVVFVRPYELHQRNTQCQYLPLIPIHTTVFVFDLFGSFLRNETVIFFRFETYLRGIMWEGEHLEVLNTCHPRSSDMSNSSLHSSSPGNATCTISIWATNEFWSTDFVVHSQNPVPLKPAGKPEEVK